MSSEIVKYSLDNGQDIEVTEQDVRDLLAACGQVEQNVTTQEVKTFMRLCQAQRLNPFTRDAYMVKYGSAPATIITGKDAFTKRAFRHPKFRGMEAGITVIGTDGGLHRRNGSMLLQGETLAGGWCRVFVEDYEAPMFDEVTFSEYSAPDKYGKNGWARMPATMIRKVAITHALREAFPEDLGGLYGEEEMSRAEYEIPDEDVRVEDTDANEADAREPSDPRKTLWEQAAALKAQATALGVKESGIDSWMATSIVEGNGSPKPKNHYEADDIAKLNDYLSSRIRDMEELRDVEAEYEEPELAPEDIAF